MVRVPVPTASSTTGRLLNPHTTVIVVPGRPVPQGSITAFRHRSTGAVVTPQKPAVREYRDRIAWAARQAGTVCTDEAVVVRAIFRFARPKSHWLTNGGLAKKAPSDHCSRPDLDKLCRSLLDAISGGVLLYDDAQVVRIEASKMWHDTDSTWVNVTLQ